MANITEELLPGIFRARIPLPRNPLKTINSYIVPDRERTLVIDLGFDLPECKEALFAALAEVGRPWESVQILATHGHPDHIGLLDSLPSTGFPVLGGFSSLDEVRVYYVEERTVYGPVEAQLRSDLVRGLIDEGTKNLADIEQAEDRLKPTDPSAPSFKAEFSSEYLTPSSSPAMEKLSEGETVSAGLYRFEVMETPGHDNWHVCLHDKERGIAIVGDHVLRRITPTISSWRPQNEVLSSCLANLRRMPDDKALVALPAHGKPILSLRAEANRIIAHHDARLEEFFELVRQGYDNVVTIAANASWRYDGWYSWDTNQQLISMGETLAHLFRLASEERIQMLREGRYAYRFIAN